MGKNAFYLTPGPSELYFTAEDHIRKAFADDIPSISHRSAEFKKIYQEAAENLRSLLNIPAGHHILFANSGTEIFQHVLMNCAGRKSGHFVNGAFSERFYDSSRLLGKEALLWESPFGEGCDTESVSIPDDCELICVTQNETSSGAALATNKISDLKKAHQDKLLVVDAVSSAPYPDFDFRYIDSLLFSVQKGMGMPAGLGVWIANDACVEKSALLKSQGFVTGAYADLPTLVEKAQKFQTIITPNVLGIYLLAKVSGDMLRKGIGQIRKETAYKAGLGYHIFEKTEGLTPFVKNPQHRSQTVLVAETGKGQAAGFIEKLKKAGIHIGGGYGKFEDSHIRIANFPTHSKEIFERAMDVLEGLA